MKASFVRIIVLIALLAMLIAPLAQPVRAYGPQDTSLISADLRAQGDEKAALQEQLNRYSTAVGARLGEAVDPHQVSVQGPLERGLIQLTPETRAAYAYVQPYREPDDWAHRNYCGAGAALVLLSHWDPNYPARADIDELGREMGLDPDAGVWIRSIVRPVNERLNDLLGVPLNWYRYGQARSLEDFRWIVNIDIQQNAVPFITGIMTWGMPGWGSRNVGHIIAVYGYTRHPDGTELISYVDTAPPVSGYSGWILNAVELGRFWQAVSGNSAQVW